MLRLSVDPARRARDRPRGAGDRRALARSPSASSCTPAASRSPCSPPRAARCAARSRPPSPRSAATRASCCATFDEVRDADAWAAADVPGSPFAVALDADGTVLAKGTFNTAAPAGVRARGRRAATRCGECLSDSVPTGVAAATSRRGFLARVSGAVMGVAGARNGRRAGRAGRRRGVPLLRPHLHDRLLPAPDRPAADRPQGPPAARQGRPRGRRPRPLIDASGRAGRRGRPPAHRRRRAPAADRQPHARSATPSASEYGFDTAHRRRLVPLLRRPACASSSTAAAYSQQAHQRRQGR